MYFDTCETLDELKKEYKKLALKNHPDCGGDENEMKKINNAYTIKFEQLKNKQNQTAKNNKETKETTEMPNEYIEIIERLLKIAGIEIELCGSWLWVTGNTYAHKTELKNAGCRWSRSKKAWYWHHPEKGARWYKGTQDMATIRDKYGSERFYNANLANV